MIGNISDKHCVLTLVDHKSGYVMIGKLRTRTVEATNRRAVRLINNAARFATPYHSWERGTSENTNGLIRQYLRSAPPWPTSPSVAATESLKSSTPDQGSV